MQRTTILCKVEDSNIRLDNCDYRELSPAIKRIQESVRESSGRDFTESSRKDFTDDEVITLLGMTLEHKPAIVIDLRSKPQDIGHIERSCSGLLLDIVGRKKYHERISNRGREGLILAVFRAPDADRPEYMVFDSPVGYRSLFIGVADNDELTKDPDGCFLAAFSERLKQWNTTGDGSWRREFQEDSVIGTIAALAEARGDPD